MTATKEIKEILRTFKTKGSEDVKDPIYDGDAWVIYKDGSKEKLHKNAKSFDNYLLRGFPY